jgi:hypothetical protein
MPMTPTEMTPQYVEAIQGMPQGPLHRSQLSISAQRPPYVHADLAIDPSAATPSRGSAIQVPRVHAENSDGSTVNSPGLFALSGPRSSPAQATRSAEIDDIRLNMSEPNASAASPRAATAATTPTADAAEEQNGDAHASGHVRGMSVIITPHS